MKFCVKLGSKLKKQRRISDTRSSMDEAVKKGGDYESWNKENIKEDTFKFFKPGNIRYSA